MQKAKVAKRPEDRPINASGWFGLCLYNIPQGTLIVLLPGISLLIIGAILLGVWWPPDHISLIMAILGGLLTVGSLIYWSIMWCRYRPQKVKKQSIPQIQLVGIYNINTGQNGMTNPAFVH